AANAKVLELGCSMGGNIITQALYYPDAEFVGIDLSGRQVAQGNAIIEKMGLKNVRLEEKDILTVDESFGKFDYIIVHGIWSWVPDTVKDKIFSICRNNLTKHGIAYISYNVYPGWWKRGRGKAWTRSRRWRKFWKTTKAWAAAANFRRFKKY
ncbi:class I SAM-dependent methyltransferase, partial [Enterobacter hormaechei subsp. steigerwaltii]|nr:class I SAM-dependent methyltransferase [Enterobacter hormaechei subsp. steigerwaltii]